MGALFYVLPRLERIAQAKNLRLRSVKRSASASPATGSAKAHELEQKNAAHTGFRHHNQFLIAPQRFALTYSGR